MLIINADDFGGWKSATDAIASCFDRKAITSASAMVFMEDSERAAAIAREKNLRLGLHLNFDSPFTAPPEDTRLRASQARLNRYFRKRKLSSVFYHPLLRRDFERSISAQLNEFRRLYSQEPAHIDGHRHLHLCANVVWADLLPAGIRVRRNFSFFPGDKSILNRAYRGLINRRVSATHKMTDYFFSLKTCLTDNTLDRVRALSSRWSVELMTHPEWPQEHKYLLGEEHSRLVELAIAGN